MGSMMTDLRTTLARYCTLHRVRTFMFALRVERFHRGWVLEAVTTVLFVLAGDGMDACPTYSATLFIEDSEINQVLTHTRYVGTSIREGSAP
jgi:hypothetical protein